MLEVEIESKDFESSLDSVLEQVSSTGKTAVLKMNNEPVAYIMDIHTYNEKKAIIADPIPQTDNQQQD
ncbi:hypothetical protein ACS91_22805 [Vibrio parahaemolyticus]|uniref:hypothetical protein n=1 Tax=Vibrio parahaemolyticus TaxID=670 RepID=UPI0006A650B0|nr:hypothetical protein ACS91_22805 [Vibrio parahaemolyticus]